MKTAMTTQQGDQTARELRDQIREQVRQQVDAARERARIAREQARATAQPPQPPGELRNTGFGAVNGDAALGIAFFIMVAVIIVGLPIARAFARRLDRRPVPSAMGADLTAQLQRIEHAVEAMAIEVERISEAQRYMARLQAERGAEPAAVPPGTARQ